MGYHPKPNGLSAFVTPWKEHSYLAIRMDHVPLPRLPGSLPVCDKAVGRQRTFPLPRNHALDALTAIERAARCECRQWWKAAIPDPGRLSPVLPPPQQPPLDLAGDAEQ